MLCSRNHCLAVLRSHRPLEIAARACRGASWRSKSPLEHAFSCSTNSKSLLGRAPQPPAARNRCSGVPRNLLAFEITARARFFVFGNTRKRRPSVSARSRGSSKRRWIRQRFRVSCGIPFEIPFGIALLRTLHCFELCLVRLHRHCQVPYANLVPSFGMSPTPTRRGQTRILPGSPARA